MITALWLWQTGVGGGDGSRCLLQQNDCDFQTVAGCSDARNIDSESVVDCWFRVAICFADGPIASGANGTMAGPLFFSNMRKRSLTDNRDGSRTNSELGAPFVLSLLLLLLWRSNICVRSVTICRPIVSLVILVDVASFLVLLPTSDCWLIVLRWNLWNLAASITLSCHVNCLFGSFFLAGEGVVRSAGLVMRCDINACDGNVLNGERLTTLPWSSTTSTCNWTNKTTNKFSIDWMTEKNKKNGSTCRSAPSGMLISNDRSTFSLDFVSGIFVVIVNAFVDRVTETVLAIANGNASTALFRSRSGDVLIMSFVSFRLSLVLCIFCDFEKKNKFESRT